MIERPEKPLLCLEIKSFESLSEEDISAYIRLTKDLPESEAIVLSQDRFMKRFDHVHSYPWRQGLIMLFPEVEI